MTDASSGTTTAPRRIFIGPVEIAGYYSQLAAALRDEGAYAVSADLSGHPFRYDQTAPREAWVRLAIWAANGFRASRGRPIWRRVLWRGMEVVTRLALLTWSLRRFDAFIFGFGQTLLYGTDLWLLRLLGKRIVFVFNGSDARPSYVDGADMAASLGRTADDCVRMTRRKKASIRRIERYADAIVSQPAFSHFFERPVLDFFRVGVPWTPAGIDRAERDVDDEIRILHSPSHPEVKGSDRIRACIEGLRAAGHRLRLIELRGVPNETVRAEIARADFVIDQIYSDAPMVGFATEAACAGVPAIVGGYAWPELRRIYPDGSMPPVEACHPDDLPAAVLRLADDRDHRRALGERARRFVEEHWAPKQIAQRYLAILDGGVPAELRFDPRSLRYVRGVGLTEERAREIVAAVLERGGRSALQLADKPALEQAFVDFAVGNGGTI